ncbi:IclR family transcriptional regulator [Chachezhania sediminis]|uniref:IclR family transcriptional regulator n=1 Tax=Chachezhania sediminis TaxID=2599291 RepID=UPI00131C838D|nr:helix-turn-helix domain-containing protein [Chachezhania sediminis]
MVDEKDTDASGGVRALDAALGLLKAMAGLRGPASLSEIARAAGVPPSRAHRYLASFLAAGLAEQAGKSGKYDLGPGAAELGLAALARHDFVSRAAEALPGLCADTGMTGLIAVWGTAGATVVRWQRTESPTVTSMGLGTTLPLLNSATGRAFLTWAPEAPIRGELAREVDRAVANPGLLPDMDLSPEGLVALRTGVRAQGFAAVDGRFIPGLVAIAGPVLDWQEEAQAVVTLIGIDKSAILPGSAEVRALQAFCTDQALLVPGQDAPFDPAA